MSGSFNEKLVELLKQDKRFVDENKELLKAAVINRAWKTDDELIELLLTDRDAKEKFFKEIDGHLVFDLNTFIEYVSDKNFLADSYTRFKNKIGLAVDEKLLKERGEVSLVWPFKDCVLEGGQAGEEERRSEIFFNEILAQDDIDRLLDPKALTNWKRYTVNGEEEVPDIFRDENGIIRENLIIKGNNLLVLHTLKTQFAGQVKMIYIDPPYNTGSDSFGYNDNFSHSTWLTFMKNRLEVAKELLHEKGAIFIQVDDREMAYLKVLCDEVFGRDNFKECICVKTGSESGVNAINALRGEQLFKVKEYILYYSRNHEKHRFNPFYLKASSYNSSYRLEVKEENGDYVVTDVYKKILYELYGQETTRGLSSEQKQIFQVKFEDYCLKNSGSIYALKTDIQKSGEKFKQFARRNKNKGRVEKYVTSDNREILVYKGGMLTPLSERVVRENGRDFYGTLISDFWWDIGATPSSEGGVGLKSGKKPEKLIKRLIDLVAAEKDDIVMDFFLGSGTTAAVAHKMGLQYIGVEQLHYQENDSVTRLQKVIGDGKSCDKTGISKSVGWIGGGTFLTCELLKYNEYYVEKVDAAGSSEELAGLFKEIIESSFLKWHIDTSEMEHKLQEFASLCGEENGILKQKNLLFDMLNKNQLYVNLSEIEDASHGATSRDRELNRKFYDTLTSNLSAF